MTPLIVLLIVFGLIFMAIAIRIITVEAFRRNLQEGESVKFYIKEEKHFGHVKNVDTDQALVEYYINEDPDYLLLSKSNLYPGW